MKLTNQDMAQLVLNAFRQRAKALNVGLPPDLFASTGVRLCRDKVVVYPRLDGTDCEVWFQVGTASIRAHFGLATLLDQREHGGTLPTFDEWDCRIHVNDLDNEWDIEDGRVGIVIFAQRGMK